MKKTKQFTFYEHVGTEKLEYVKKWISHTQPRGANYQCLETHHNSTDILEYVLISLLVPKELIKCILLILLLLIKYNMNANTSKL